MTEEQDQGASAGPTGLSQAEPEEGLGPSGFDPSRSDLLDYIQTSAWIGLVEYLMGQDWAIAQFTAETGVAVPRRRSGIEAMIDKAVGYDGNMEFIRAFLPWVTREHWGEDEMVPGIAGILARLRDSDGSPKGGDACGSVHDSAGPKDIAQGNQP